MHTRVDGPTLLALRPGIAEGARRVLSDMRTRTHHVLYTFESPWGSPSPVSIPFSLFLSVRWENNGNHVCRSTKLDLLLFGGYTRLAMQEEKKYFQVGGKRNKILKNGNDRTSITNRFTMRGAYELPHYRQKKLLGRQYSKYEPGEKGC